MSSKQITIAASIAVLLLGLAAWMRTSPAQRFSEQLAAQARANPGHIALRELVTIPWDHVHLFGPFTPPDMIEVALGFPYSDRAVEKLQSSDAINLLLFVSGRKVVLSVAHPRSEGDFPSDTLPRSMTPDEAVFTAGRRSSGWIELRPVSK
jgi:hypothetical protein